MTNLQKERTEELYFILSVLEKMGKISHHYYSSIDLLNNRVNSIIDELWGSPKKLKATVFEDTPSPKRSQEDIDKEIDEACTNTKLPKFGYKQAMQLLKENIASTKEIRLAREGWDNLANSEYITMKFGYGIVKIYETLRHDYEKHVMHTYKPTVDDMKTEDWLVINQDN